MLEAICRKCGETFIPANAEDIIHQIKEDGSHCGGTGDIGGEYFRRSVNGPPPTFEDLETQAAYDDLWRL